MEYVSVFPFSINNSGEVVILVRRDGDFYRDLGGHVYNEMSPMHSAAKNLLTHSNYLIVPSNIERLLKKKPISKDESVFREVLAKLLTLPSHMCIKNIANLFGYLYPVPFIDPEILNTTLEDTSLHWIRISILFSVEEYQRFFSAFDLAILGQVNTHLLKQSITLCKDPVQRITHKIGIINLEEEVLWQFHLEALLLSNVFQSAYRSKEVKFEFFESELPTLLEIEKMACLVVVAWREKHSSHVIEELSSFFSNKKIIAIGTAADAICESLGGKMVAAETCLELVDTVPTNELSLCGFMKKYLGKPEAVENCSVLKYSNKIVAELPSDAMVLAVAHNSPCVYLVGNVLCVHANPEFSVQFVEQLFSTELISQNLLSEEAFEVAKKAWDESADINVALIRNICEGFMIG
jgi:hypothetical protein